MIGIVAQPGRQHQRPVQVEPDIELIRVPDGPVQLDVYSLSGQKVRTLVDQTQSAGVYSVAWNGQDDNGRSVASGVYLACLKSAEAMLVQKMLLLK